MTSSDRILRSRCRRHGECLCTDQLKAEPHHRRRVSSGPSRLLAMPLNLVTAVSSAVRSRLLSTEPSQQQVMTTATLSYSEAGSVSRKMLAQAAPPPQWASELARNPALLQLEKNRAIENQQFNRRPVGYCSYDCKISLCAFLVFAVVAAAYFYHTHPHAVVQLTEAAARVAPMNLAGLAASLWSWSSSLLTVAKADQLPDYALLSGGARVESTRDSRAYGSSSLWRQLLWFWWQRPGPEVALTASVEPGVCWAFVGFPGRLAVRLSHPIRVSAVSIDHVPRQQSYNNSVASAPRAFSVYGLTEACIGLDEAVKLGSFTYDAEAGPATQTFRLAGGATAERYQFVELVVHSNHGCQDYTCLYRLRVHGHMD